MGSNNSTEKEDVPESLTAEEFAKLKTVFKSGFGEKIGKNLSEENLKDLWKGKLERDLYERIIKYLFRNQNGSPSKKSGVDFKQFCDLFVQAVRGSVDKKAALIACISSGKTEMASTADVKEYVKDIIISYIQAEKSTKQFQSWAMAGCKLDSESVNRFASSLVHDLIFPGKSTKETWTLKEEPMERTVEEIERWLMASPDLNNMQAAVFERLYFGTDTPAGDDAVCLFPFCKAVTRGALNEEGFPSLLDMASIAFLNAALPTEMRENWRFLFSSRIHGESFSKMLGSILNKGATIVIVKDKYDHVFGGFATESWNLGPQFVGNENCFLFNIKPKMNIYPTTGYNNHYMYLNIQQQTMPNGLGMGGVMEYFGLFLDSSYGAGMCSETCTTYHSPMLSANKNFEIAHLEVWGVGPPPKSPAELGERPSILDYDNEAKAILAMAGKGGHSDGYRDPDEFYEPK